MTQTVSVTRRIRRPVEEVSAFVEDARRMLPMVTGLGRCEYVGNDAGGELWDVFLDVGTIHVGGRVLVTVGEGSLLSWRSLRGTRNSFTAAVDPDGDASRITLKLAFTSAGFGMGVITELIARGIMARTLEAAVEELRHQLEFEQ